MTGTRVAAVVVAVLIGIIAALGAVIVAMAGGVRVALVIGSGAAAFSAAVTLTLLIESALGVLPG